MNENDPIREYQSKMHRCIDNAERLRQVVKSCQDAIERAGVKASVVVEGDVTHAVRASIFFPVTTIRDVVPLLRELAKEGLHTDKKDNHKDHNFLDVIGTREYNLGPQCRLYAVVFSGAKEASCRMQKVGEKTVPVYEMVCDEREPVATE